MLKSYMIISFILTIATSEYLLLNGSSPLMTSSDTGRSILQKRLSKLWGRRRRIRK